MDYSFDHVHIICKDFDKMTAYFERVFGAEEVYREDNFHGAPNAVMKLGSARFFLRGVRPEETLGVAAPDAIMGLDHFSLAVDDVHAAAVSVDEVHTPFLVHTHVIRLATSLAEVHFGNKAAHFSGIERIRYVHRAKP